MPEQKILKVSEINLLAKKILEANFPCILIEGEISNLVEPSSGHIYFSLKDKFAQVRSVMFRQYNSKLSFQPENGMHVVVHAQVSLYEARGDYQLIVEKMENKGEGILHAKFLQLKNKLEKEGLFAEKYKKPLPTLPQTIGVITSPTGAVIRDILNVLKRRFPSTKVIIYPTMVQGTEATTQIVTALQKAGKRKECEVLILARGGGSIEDLWPFNEEKVAREIFTSKIPIISAIGHETDFTISDFTADLRAPTPSAAAELVVPNISDWYQNLENLKYRLFNLIQNKLEQINTLFTNLKNRLRHPYYYLTAKIQKLDEIEHRLNLAIKNRLSYHQQVLAKLGAGLDAVSPLATLSRGYAIVSKDDKIISKTKDVKTGDLIQTRISDGKLLCLVENIKTLDSR